MTANVSIPLKKGDFFETCAACLLALIHYLQLKLTIWVVSWPRKHINCTPRFKKVIFRPHYVMRKNSSCIEPEQCYLCRVMHFNHQNLMLITPPNSSDQATAFWHLLEISRWTQKTVWDVPRNVFLILVTASSGTPTPELCFLLGHLSRAGLKGRGARGNF